MEPFSRKGFRHCRDRQPPHDGQRRQRVHHGSQRRDRVDARAHDGSNHPRRSGRDAGAAKNGESAARGNYCQRLVAAHEGGHVPQPRRASLVIGGWFRDSF